MANGTAAKTPSANPKGDGFFARLINWRFLRFIKESWNETFHKSSWPTKKELWAFTVVVLFALIIVGAWIGTLDAIFKAITEMIS
ncbi:MAG: preprotein translocase subunit SecE [Armatimonadetes bacterium]|nr:preprotein translocase subunit SecE [Armatimonadota bacterium]